jgi:hypothetical protein
MQTMKAVPAAVRTADLPADEPELLRRFSTVLKASNRHHTRISEVLVPLARYPSLANTFWHIPIVDSQEPCLRVLYSAA